MPNPFAGSRGYARLSNIFMVPIFRLLPIPSGFVLLTTTGRRTGKQRHRPVRAVRRHNTLYAVAMLGERSDWLKNVRRQARLGVKIRGKRVQGLARQVTDPAENAAAADLYVSEVFPVDYTDYASYHWGFPTRRKIIEAHKRWAAEGIMVAIELEQETK